ncbi:hypothetical protein Clacol_006182 [Clathrus columnatus]|uniref:Uncharacterized protein n=1 Tax=Clathrus columnatus TaxID=1419009 RepID=A0AAV5AFH9_9AGAM|nr:hypothetical protein Clacol_006182 [Clathrus columnatus]
MSSNKTIPPNFNPHAVHYFTSNVTSSAPPAYHNHNENAYIPMASPHTTSPTSIHNHGPFSGSHSPSLIPPSSQFTSPASLPAPQPRLPPKPAQPSTSPPIFTPFRPERSSPELIDVLSKKKSASAWPAQPVLKHA